MAYSTQAKLELMYGETNIIKWADLDNDNNATKIKARIAQALVDAEDYVNGRLIQGRYTAPFTGTAPRVVSFITTLYGGILLYDGRMISGSGKSMRDEVSRHRKQFNKYLREILSGQLKLTSAISGEALPLTSFNYPFPLDTEEDEIIENIDA